MEKNDKKRIELTLNDLDGSLDKISLVSDPAIMVDFFYFNKQDLKFKVENEEMRMVTGPFMIPDMDIFRIDPVTGEQFFVYFSKETIRKAAEMFFRKSNPNATNLEHKMNVDDLTVMESWIVDIENGKGGGKNFTNMKDGTWMGTYKVNNEEVWNDFIKTGIVKGFSVEGVFIESFMNNKNKKSIDILYDEIVKIVKSIDK